ncbi:hypothetical protein Mp_3g01240 [Marchantia polymorpha subsp. ruderalis]|uniref:Uncharacterized protein n=2 Tax=Marchantia polymorpha TaxID=3197 RepID=A0AAF6AW90_MARPO|nr:hypothetical protein MARPO_0007s0118 [Marchantia polymorpha]BBN04024.1 hypothetical protein Mp_3g01240 [Marchantia polymorpha subsp. ruderalis]|eukprot:PTQ47711.1 hypothetical protein MARPO_0007s0118 [Marchantia polymorpha]
MFCKGGGSGTLWTVAANRERATDEFIMDGGECLRGSPCPTTPGHTSPRVRPDAGTRAPPPLARLVPTPVSAVSSSSPIL